MSAAAIAPGNYVSLSAVRVGPGAMEALQRSRHFGKLLSRHMDDAVGQQVLSGDRAYGQLVSAPARRERGVESGVSGRHGGWPGAGHFASAWFARLDGRRGTLVGLVRAAPTR